MEEKIEVAKEKLAAYFEGHDDDITPEQAAYLANCSLEMLKTVGQIAIHQVAAKGFSKVRKGAAKAAKVAKVEGVAAKASQRKKISVPLPIRLQSIIKPDGKTIGKQLGNNPAIHTISDSEAKQVIQKLIKSGAKKAKQPPIDYPGTWYQFPNGKGFGVRITNSTESLRHGTKNCIDLDQLRIGLDKLKF